MEKQILKIHEDLEIYRGAAWFPGDSRVMLLRHCLGGLVNPRGLPQGPNNTHLLAFQQTAYILDQELSEGVPRPPRYLLGYPSTTKNKKNTSKTLAR